MARYRHKPLRVPNAAAQVATYNANGVLLDANGDPLVLDGGSLAAQSVERSAAAFPTPILLQPDNSEEPVTVDLATAAYDSGTRIYIEPVATAVTNTVTITPDGSLVDPEGVAVEQCVLNAAGSFAICDIIGGVTVLSAYKGADLTI
jgi:hypothetical protein